MGEEFHLLVMWVGDPKQFERDRNTARYQHELDDFLHKNVGVP